MPIASPTTMASPTHSLYSHHYALDPASSRGFTCAYPSWPTGPSLGYRSTPSSYISDADLFGDDVDDHLACPFLQEAPAPPRMPPVTHALPVLPPLYAPKKPKTERRRSSGRKQRRTSKPMTPISESPEQVE